MLDDCNILVVEDEILIALDISCALEDDGAAILGPCGTIEAALAICERADVAVLDVDICGKAVFPVADRMRAIGKPFIFHTARVDHSDLVARYGPDVEIITKPARIGAVIAAVARSTGRLH